MYISKVKTTLNPNSTSPVIFLSSTQNCSLYDTGANNTLQDAIPLDFTYEKLFGTQGQEKVLG